ncbi:MULTISPECIES: SGNH/GDSL hydrolase family protein [Nocardia]|uniref:SGNH/GDSL hydrolase family protein n=1 Tax=Nocardia TaxID=1817 RepID=UPI000BEF3B09|nr:MULTISPECIES: SGNH/GDSL hydrolase family protein [Nocardia]MBF6184426.1 SGNH/GDSL hydrolase family protein [Nocardia farcinica]MBF6310270.1 SGNH/GDSL hydrolase family protein [Nocardia farcinica]MBF6371762.1 SGNH/GDSL hydrolase family protein [Nocardia farcinica]MBF6405910.1 SGNH/GDSL hydrolase family protein [Nocardia farcinica]MBF6575792.1 SGNH/GDSL hydrolase family protein [Nocardia farcinica]
MPLGHRLAAAAAGLLALPGVLLPGATAAPTDGGAEYVALGDSGAATTGVRDLDLGAPLLCARSTADTPKLVAAELGLRLDDRTCSSAKIDHLSISQGPGIAPQFDALGPATRLVTVHIGANDTGMTSYVVGCHLAGLGMGACTTDGWDAAIDGIADEYSAALERISQLAPNARVIVDGWPTYVRPGGCPELVGLRPEDAVLVQRAFDRLNAVVARAAAEHGADYVDTRGPSEGRDMCAPAGVRWFDPVLATETLLPYHPTPQGMRGVADLIVAAVRAR